MPSSFWSNRIAPRKTQAIVTARHVDTLPPAKTAYTSTTGTVRTAANLGTDQAINK